MGNEKANIVEQLVKIKNAKDGLKTAMENAGFAIPETFEHYGDVIEPTILGMEKCITRLKCSYPNVSFSNCPMRKLEFPHLQAIAGSGHFRNNIYLEEVTLPEITTLLTDMFAGCVNLRTINIPGVISITNFAFANAYEFEAEYPTHILAHLTELHLPGMVDNDGIIGLNAFGKLNVTDGTMHYYTNIRDLYFPNKTQAQIEAMGNYGSWGLHPECRIHPKSKSGEDIWFYYKPASNASESEAL